MTTPRPAARNDIAELFEDDVRAVEVHLEDVAGDAGNGGL
jgi:hypothetical protein